MKEPFRWEGGEIVIDLEPGAWALLRTLPSLLGSVGAAADDPAVRRLSLPAYPGDPSAQEEFDRYVGPELETARTADRETFAAAVDAGERLSIEEAEAWLRVIGEARLVVAARKGIQIEDESWEDRVLEDPDLGLVAFLGYLQDGIVGALNTALEEAR